MLLSQPSHQRSLSFTSALVSAFFWTSRPLIIRHKSSPTFLIRANNTFCPFLPARSVSFADSVLIPDWFFFYPECDESHGEGSRGKTEQQQPVSQRRRDSGWAVHHDRDGEATCRLPVLNKPLQGNKLDFLLTFSHRYYSGGSRPSICCTTD